MISLKKILNIISILGLMFSILFVLSGCSINEIKYDREEIMQSPSDEYSITLKYDYVSRPYIFKDNKMIFKYDGSEFNEIV